MKISEKDVFVFVLAGGEGKRFWPLSRKKMPKQFLPIFGSQSMLQKTHKRLKEFISPDRTYIITPNSQLKAIKKQLPEFKRSNFIIEPEARGTAAAIGLAAISVRYKNPKGIMVIVPADQYIEGINKFKKTLNNAVSAAILKDKLITIGIKPTFASSGYGYLKFGKSEKFNFGSVNKIEKFIEKPSKERALKFIKSEKYYFNSGVFIWRIDRFLKEIELHMPDLYRGLLCIERVCKKSKRDKIKAISPIYKRIKPDTIDYGLMQKTDNIMGIKADFKWTDAGSLRNLEEIYPKKSKSNIVINTLHIKKDTQDCIVCGQRDHLIATLGLKDIIIVQTPDVTLVARKEDSQKIKELVDKISKNKKLKKFI